MKLLPLLAVLALVPLLCADVITLNDGTRLEGKVEKTDDGWIVTDNSGKQTTVTADQVGKFELSGSGGLGAAGGGDATDALIALRQSADNMSDLQQIIDRYQRFIDAHAGTPALADAQADLQVWKQRLSQGDVKVGTVWMSADERQKLVGQETAVAEKVRDLLTQSRNREADQAIDQALAVDPNNISILYLQGVELANQGKTLPARAAFEKVKKSAPDHAPTLNNLAILLFRQKLAPAGMNLYVQAMQARPDDKQILDNVAEALKLLTDEEKQSIPGQRAAVIFKQQDADLARTMETQGLYRWGSNWVTQKQLDDCTAAEERNKGKEEALQEDMDATDARIRADQGTIATDSDAVTRLQGLAQMPVTDSHGNRAYVYRSVADADRLQSEITQLQGDIHQNQLHEAALRQQEKDLEGDYPIPKFTGTQQIIGPEGTPLIDDAAATQPAQ